ncbi:MAG TPA: alpha-glucan family phosphorylase [Pyrinomonadaceae bacterium]|nr:alpha-glucan family phosphorylase [Pyrinomonadaceae bacterium]
MEDVLSQNSQAMQAIQQREAETFRDNFNLLRALPANLISLDVISQNFAWSWLPGGTELFRNIDPRLWMECEQNPRIFLERVDDFSLRQRAADSEYIERLHSFEERLADYLAAPPQPNGHITSEYPAAYFCAEFGVHNSLPIYSGGLGILAGDHLKSASDLNVPLVAVGLLYRFGYFRQRVGHDGGQVERYLDSFDSRLAVTPVTNAAGERVKVMVHIRGREVFAQAWLARIGRVALYLLDTHVPENAEYSDRMITGHLYGGSTETRIVQEKILGIGGVRLLRTLGIAPSVFHLNEGHSAFLLLELANEYLRKRPEATWEEAAAAVREQCVFTTHTPVAAGNDAFSPDELAGCFDANFIHGLKLTSDEFFDLGRTNPDDDSEYFGMTPLALRLTRSANGVSVKHGEVSRELWLKMYPEGTNVDDVPITSVTNGVHAPTWIAPAFQALYKNAVGSDWDRTLADPDAWKNAVDNIPDSQVWHAHRTMKQLLVSYIRRRTWCKEEGLQATINEHLETKSLLSPDVLTIGFARRVAAYKRWNLIMTDLDRLLQLVDDPSRPVQFVFAGKAHPQDMKAKQMLRELMSINNNSSWQERAVFIEDYDQDVAKYLVHGVDIWLNVPRRPMEASGTSGMKAAMNGVLNCSILDGWWIEGYNGENGFAIGDLSEDPNEEISDAADAESLYSVLERQLVPAYYELNEDGLPERWIAMMKNALATLTPQFSTDRMVAEYFERIYNPK